LPFEIDFLPVGKSKGSKRAKWFAALKTGMTVAKAVELGV
jgi:hypothetical protein